MLTMHGECGKWWWQAGNRTSHCSGCHETFTSLSLFDAHFDREGPRPTCRDPRAMLNGGRPLLVETSTGSDGVWYSPAARDAARAAFATETGD